MSKSIKLTPHSNCLQDKNFLAELKKIIPSKDNFIQTKNGYIDWTFEQLVKYQGFKDAAKIVEEKKREINTANTTLIISYEMALKGKRYAPLTASQPKQEKKSIEPMKQNESGILTKTKEGEQLLYPKKQIIVNIPKSVPKEEEELSSSSFTNEEHNTPNKNFTKEIYEHLPSFLKDCIEHLVDPIEKEVFLVGALGVISGALPNVIGHYDTKWYGTNLYTYILAAYGSGKGSLSLCKHLGAAIHNERKRLYKEELAKYKALKRQQKKDPDLLQEKPIEPNIKVLYIPANNSKTGVFELLDSNDGKGIIFETEGDTITDAIKQDYGNYTDGLNKAFHHEAISYYRRGGKELVEIPHPYLSVVLSSTFDQLRYLMPTIENGFYSRFLYYQIKSDFDFKNVFDSNKKNYTSYIKKKGEELAEFYNYLNEQTVPIEFTLQEHQQKQFLDLFRTWKGELKEFDLNDLQGTVNRLGLICFRIAMIFSTLRMFEDGESLQKLVCTDEDFNNAIAIIEILKYHSYSVYYKIMPPKKKAHKNKFEEKADKIKMAIELRSKGWVLDKIAQNLKVSKSTLHRWLNRY